MVKRLYLLFFFNPFLVFFLQAQDQLTYRVHDLQAGRPIDSKNAETPMLLASLSKIPSLYFAHQVLGSDFRFSTKMYHDGQVEKGTLNGNLYLVGGGDPFLQMRDLMFFVLELKKKGVKTIQGDLVIDNSLFETLPRLDPIGQEDQADNPAIAALSLEFNRFQLNPRQERFRPALDSFDLVKAKKAEPGALKFSFALQPKKEKEIWSLHRLPASNWVDLPTRRPVLWVAKNFMEIAQLEQIQIKGFRSGKTPQSAKMILQHKSLPLAHLVAMAFEYSNNLFAELPVLVAAQKVNPSVRTLKQAAQTMLTWYQKKTGDKGWKEAELANASGLSLDNKMSADLLTKFLAYIEKAPAGRAFQTYMSSSGHSGGLKTRYKDQFSYQRIWAKTGSLFYVSNIAGYFYGNSGKKYAFTLMQTESKKREQLNRSPSGSIKLHRQAGPWQNQAKLKADQMIRAWIKKY
jgi:D-alanyl-D-alanine carboxypeptidase/D-alanyl-D-alanine-endopeptidase (penicillin-binding protein 4)